jgi:hypothetical protein
VRPSSSHLTTASSSLDRLTVPKSPVGLPKIAQTLDAISGFQFLVHHSGLAERRLLGSV